MGLDRRWDMEEGRGKRWDIGWVGFFMVFIYGGFGRGSEVDWNCWVKFVGIGFWGV